MITLSLLVCLIGLVVWLAFTKLQSIADSWVSEVGKLCFFAGLLAYLLNVGMKTV